MSALLFIVLLVAVGVINAVLGFLSCGENSEEEAVCDVVGLSGARTAIVLGPPLALALVAVVATRRRLVVNAGAALLALQTALLIWIFIDISDR